MVRNYSLNTENKQTMNIRVLIPAKCRQDKASGQWVVYSSEYGVSGYGATLPKARAMFVEQVKEVLKPFKKKK